MKRASDKYSEIKGFKMNEIEQIIWKHEVLREEDVSDEYKKWVVDLTKDIEQYVIKARIEEHEQLKISSCPHIDSDDRLVELKKGLD